MQHKYNITNFEINAAKIKMPSLENLHDKN